MGLFMHFAHKSTQKRIQKMVEHFHTGTQDSRAGMIFYTWLTRGINLATVRKHDVEKLERLREKVGPVSVNIPIYYYGYGAEVPIIELVELYSRGDRNTFSNSIAYALTLHQYTNLAISYPTNKYGGLVRRLWDSLIQNYTNLNEVIKDLKPLIEQPEMQKIISNNDVSIQNLIKDPKQITPHFLVSGHPLSVTLLELDKLKYQLWQH